MISITSNFSTAPIETEDQNNIVKVPRGNKCQTWFISQLKIDFMKEESCQKGRLILKQEQRINGKIWRNM